MVTPRGKPDHCSMMSKEIFKCLIIYVEINHKEANVGADLIQKIVESAMGSLIEILVRFSFIKENR